MYLSKINLYLTLLLLLTDLHLVLLCIEFIKRSECNRVLSQAISHSTISQPRPGVLMQALGL